MQSERPLLTLGALYAVIIRRTDVNNMHENVKLNKFLLANGWLSYTDPNFASMSRLCLFLQLCIQCRTTRVPCEDDQNRVTLVSDDQIPLCLPTVMVLGNTTTNNNDFISRG